MQAGPFASRHSFMKRSEFLKAAGVMGFCCCAGAAGLAQSPAAKPSDTPEVNELRRKLDFMQKRIARLIQALEEPTRKKVLETMGRECAREFGHLTGRFKGKPKEFLEEARRIWMDKADYDEKAGTIRVMDRPGNCTCAFVRIGLTPPEFCQCSVGWQKEAYATILGKPMDAEIESSVLRGDERCAFRMQAKPKV
jgi:predicted ArsR family transcriptional regulator